MQYLKGREKVLDAGCGTGRDAFFLSSKGLEVIGVDASRIAIQRAKEKTGSQSNPEFLVGQVENLPFSDSSFDAAYSGYVLGGSTLEGQFKELSRTIKPDGILYVAMFTRTKYEKPSERDEENPIPFITDSYNKYFEIIDQSEDSYVEEDDQGKHQHDRIRLALVNKK